MAVIDRTLDIAALPPDCATGLVPFSVEIDITIADLDATNQVLVFQFPQGAKVLNNGASLIVDNDDLEGATPALVVDLGFGAVDGVLDITTDTGSTAFQAASTFPLAEVDAAGVWLDVSELYFIIDVTTAQGANPAAGTLRFGGWFTRNVIEHT
jgi:hypothetical protein